MHSVQVIMQSVCDGAIDINSCSQSKKTPQSIVHVEWTETMAESINLNLFYNEDIKTFESLFIQYIRIAESLHQRF